MVAAECKPGRFGPVFHRVVEKRAVGLVATTAATQQRGATEAQ